jgi:ATP-dependent DNA helicase RecG
MDKIRVFISSVQNEFTHERQMLFDYLMQDALLGLFFEPFVFEKLPASDRSAANIYLSEVEKCDIYLGLFGKNYGYEDKEGISPTEHEFDLAAKLNKVRLIFISNQSNKERDRKEIALIHKAEKEVTRKKFADESELKTAVYASLIRYLEEKEYIRTSPFDASICKNASFNDIDKEKIRNWVNIAKTKRSFSLSAGAPVKDIFTHLNLIKNIRLTNAALLLFGKNPQRFFICSEIKCAQFHGNEIVKPITAYQVYKGDVFQLVDKAVDFVLSRINAKTGTRETSNQVDVDYEIPRSVVAESIVNAVAHRDYTSTGTVQIMLFKNRLEIWNPGKLPSNLTLSKLREAHGSFPANPLLAEPMYLAGYIERLGTGTSDMIRLCKDKKLKEPEFRQEDVFKTIIWRSCEITDHVTDHVTDYVTDYVNENIIRIISILSDEMNRNELMNALNLKHPGNFREKYLHPALKQGFIEMSIPDKPKSIKQKYRLTGKGLKVKNQEK